MYKVQFSQVEMMSHGAQPGFVELKNETFLKKNMNKYSHHVKFCEALPGPWNKSNECKLSMLD
jgi:hypothetical protein